MVNVGVRISQLSPHTEHRTYKLIPVSLSLVPITVAMILERVILDSILVVE
jgi:hypothetical protein